jgi:tetratricopeptide (TPR) repeat protein
MRRAVTLAAACSLLLAAAPARAQKDQFVASVRELITVAGPAGPARDAAIQAVADRMAAALAQWDRTIAAMATGITRDLETARGRRAYELHLALAVTYLERGRLADAERHLTLASGAEPAATNPHVLRAAALELSGTIDAAAREWHVVWISDRNNPVKAYHLFRSGGGTTSERAAAARVIQAAYERLLSADEPPRPLSLAAFNVVPDTFSTAPIVGDAATASAFAHIAEARYDDAVAALRHVPAAGESPLVRFTRGREYVEANHVGEARREFEAALAGTLSGRSLLYAGIGRLAQVEGDFAGAVEAYRRAVQLNLNDVNMHRQLGLAYAAQGAVDEAFTELAASLLLNPRSAQDFANIGRVFLDAGRDRDALPPLYRALALAPDRYETRYAIATALTRIGRDAEAARELDAFHQAQRDALERQRKSFDAPSR